MAYLIFDIGGTWIKGLLLDETELPELRRNLEELTRRIRRVPSPAAHGDDLLGSTLLSFAQDLAHGHTIQSVAISTAGIVHPSGDHLTACADHLAFLRNSGWKQGLESHFSCPVSLINDADAFLLGVAESGRLPSLGTVCALVIGTGLGCTISKDGRFWRPQRNLPLLGSIRTSKSSYDGMASAARLAAHDPDHNLVHCLQSPELADLCDQYFSDLSRIIETATILYGADHIVLGGGLCEAARTANIDLHKKITARWKQCPPDFPRWPELVVDPFGNATTLLGAAALSVGLGVTAAKEEKAFHALVTEQTHPRADALHEKSPREMMEILWQAENEAGQALHGALDLLAEMAEHLIGQWLAGGRIIYVGAGTSGRVAALDAVEIPCTFGCPSNRVVAVVAGGLNEAGFDIESAGEEDYHASADLVLLQPNIHDTVIGISASGTSHFVRSALYCAKQRGAKTALLLASAPAEPEPWDWTIPFESGREILAGSTRMKAGTATKKLLNFLTTTVMAGVGKVRGPYMIDMTCLNLKLADRARRILMALFPISASEADQLLTQNDFNLSQAIHAIERQ